jgi:parvulin-like peptidyl-prolyl isomerase
LIYAARSVASNTGQGRKSAGLQRLALLAFGAIFILLFAIFAIAQGITNPSVPSGSVAVVEDVPDGLSPVTEAKFQRALIQAAAQGEEPVPKPGDKKYDELTKKALGEVFDSIWIQGQAAEMGIAVTKKEIADELAKLKKQSFKTEQEYKEFLKKAHFSIADVNERVTIQILSAKIQEQVTEEASQPSKGEIQDYYDAAKASQYTTPETLEIRVIKNKDKAKVEAAKAALEKDDSTKSWTEVAKKYSTDTTKSSGGLQAGVTAGQLAEPLDAAVFAAEQGEIEGPLKEATTYTVYEVMKITKEKVQDLDEVKSQISNQLAEQAKQETFARFVRGYGSRWKSRTFCASDFREEERCSNFKGTGRPPEADPACYEADPKTPAEACPALIPQVKPAQPGTISPLNREGQKLAQRPIPANLKAAAPEGATELPPGVVPEGE